MIVEKRQEKEDRLRARAHTEQAETLRARQDRDLYEIERRARALDRLEAREERSVQFATMREFFQKLVNQPGRTIKPEFDRAARGITGRAATGDDKAPAKESIPARFNRAAKPPPDLVEEFNREVENRRRREERDRDLDTGPDRTFDPDDPDR